MRQDQCLRERRCIRHHARAVDGEMAKRVKAVAGQFPRRAGMKAERVQDKHVLAHCAAVACRHRRILSLGINHHDAMRHFKKRLNDDR